MPASAKLELDQLTDVEVITLTTLIVDSMTGNARFAQPDPELTILTAQSDSMKARIEERDLLLKQTQTKTLEIRTARTLLEASLRTEASYVEGVVEKLPLEQQASAITGAGMSVADDTSTRVGAMPKVDGLIATSGDSEGEIDLQWNAIRRGLQNFLVELTEDATGQSGWRFAVNSRKSSVTCQGLTSGKRYWFRVIAEGAAGPGPASEPTTKVAP